MSILGQYMKCLTVPIKQHKTKQIEKDMSQKINITTHMSILGR